MTVSVHYRFLNYMKFMHRLIWTFYANILKCTLVIDLNSSWTAINVRFQQLTAGNYRSNMTFIMKPALSSVPTTYLYWIAGQCFLSSRVTWQEWIHNSIGNINHIQVLYYWKYEFYVIVLCKAHHSQEHLDLLYTLTRN